MLRYIPSFSRHYAICRALWFCTTALALADMVLAADANKSRPNVVIMLADDMGFGELQCLNPKRGKIPTPELDALARGGMIFTDAHSGSSVCTPTRYGLMTGRYAWRTRLQSGVLTGGESLIAPDRMTLAKLFRQHGYHTAIIGKWHLGMLFDGKHETGDVPIGAKVTHGPLDRGGFDEFHGFHHARQIRVWVENDQVTRHIEGIEMLPKLTKTAVQYIHDREGKDEPFFLYVPWSSPHSPVVPTPEWQGKSGLNAHADFVMQTDDSFGQVIQALRDTGAWKNTLVICSSDNGTSAPTSKMSELTAKGHFSSGDLRGSKADIWDGGHRVPFLVSWPKVVSSRSQSNQLVCLTDLYRTMAEMLGAKVTDDCAEDSHSFLRVLTGASTQDDTVREDVVHHSVAGYFAIRQQQWKLCLCPRSGGWTGPRPSAKSWAAAEQEGLPMVQLYDMSKDVGERTNLAPKMPEKVAQLRELLAHQVAQGRSTNGMKQSNDVPVKFAKKPKQKKKK